MSKKPDRIICILDRSRSMEAMKNEAIGGFNAFVEDQRRVPGKARLSLVLFDHEYEVQYTNKKLKRVPDLTENTYTPRGTTALFDAIGRTLVDARDTEKDYRKNIVAIITDGMENASKDYPNKSDVRRVVEDAVDAGYEFFFLAANMDAFAEGGELGIPTAGVFNYAATSAGTAQAYSIASDSVTRSRTSV